MPKDYKDAPAPRARASSPIRCCSGMIIGLLLGIVISLAVALWLNRLSNPFVEKGKQVEPIPKIAPVQPPAPPAAAKAAEEAAKGAPKAVPEKPRAEGRRPAALRVLPDPSRRQGCDGQGRRRPPCPRHRRARRSRRSPARRPPRPSPIPARTYWLQAGAFTDEKDADNLKAKIAFTGLEATVRPVNDPTRARSTACASGPTRASTTRTESRPRCPRTASARRSSAPPKTRRNRRTPRTRKRKIHVVAQTVSLLAAAASPSPPPAPGAAIAPDDARCRRSPPTAAARSR